MVTFSPEAYGLVRLDRADVRREQAREVTYRTSWMTSTQLLAYTVKALERDQARLRLLRPQRDAAALSLTVHEQVRAVWSVIGVSSSLYRRWRRQHGAVTFVPDAQRRINVLSRQVAALEERRRLLTVLRDRAAMQMLDEQWGTRQVARMMGRDAARVVQVRKLFSQAA